MDARFKDFVALFANYPKPQNDMALNNKAPVTNGANGTNPYPAPQQSGAPPTQGHRPSRSIEEEQRLRAGPRAPSKLKELNIFASPDRGENRKPRRNSESSMVDKGSLTTEEEKRRLEKRKEKDGVDLIDKLDVTGIYGAGLFHHDGPFDACNPHRNRRKDNRAPMQAFPAGSANNALGGSGPLKKNIDLDQFHGRGTEGFTDYATTSAEPYEQKKRPSVDRTMSFNPKDRGEIIHGEETYGLGTSTFLEGAPASRTAMQRRESEAEAQAFQNNGIARKKSLAQRIRGISQPRPRFGEQGLIRSPDARYEVRPVGATSPDTPQFAAINGRTGPQTTGGSIKMYEKNPFFDDYDEAYEKKGASIKVAESEKATEETSRAGASSSPMRGMPLERRVTVDSGRDGEQKQGVGGFLSRVKSLKGGRRSRPEQRRGS
ncbi:hypothetical protein H2199_007475 [Coniosporium tulheliwenetii]|uniref:Uncharacterized protein n=1 Tax=Coniosporium tulheliwenetii TaxID=3383036 RepID=A0ACC2YPH4_9PEZI|nr:hypothetical protein H2199_007475 [Cladosporium sp. JES 115]